MNNKQTTITRASSKRKQPSVSTSLLKSDPDNQSEQDNQPSQTIIKRSRGRQELLKQLLNNKSIISKQL